MDDSATSCIAFRALPADQSPSGGELWIRPRGGTVSRSLASEVYGQGLQALDAGGLPIEKLVVDAHDDQPTFDEMLACHLASKLLSKEPLAEGYAALAKYAALLRQGRTPTDLPASETLEGMYLAIRCRAGKELSDPVVASNFLHAWQRLAGAIDRAVAQGTDVFRESPFDRIADFAEERADILADEKRYRADVRRGEHWRVRLGAAKHPESALLLRTPESFLFPFWSRRDRETPTGEPYRFLAVEQAPGKWVFSTDPALPFSLKALSAKLEEAELRQRGAASGPFWYDGGQHAHTIVAAPRGGTLLPEQQVLKIVKRWCQARRAPANTAKRQYALALPLAFSAIALTLAIIVYLGRLPRDTGLKLYSQVAPAVVRIDTEQEQGSGFLISADGWIITNHHVVATARANARSGSRQVAVQLGQLINGQIRPFTPSEAAIFKEDPQRDLALLKLTRLPDGLGDLPYLTFVDDLEQVRPGIACWVVGTPRAPNEPFNLLRSGEVGSVDTSPQGKQKKVSARLIHSSCDLVPGYSGSPLVNSDGQVMGVTVAIASASADTLHVHVADLKAFIGDLSQQESEPPLLVPADLPSFEEQNFVDFSNDSHPETLVFMAMDPAIQRAETRGFWSKLRPDVVLSEVSSQEDDQKARYDFALLLEPWPTAFYDTNSDGQTDLILQSPIQNEEVAAPDLRWRRISGRWAIDAPPGDTKLLAAEHFVQADVQKAFRKIQHKFELPLRIRAARQE